MNQLGWSVGLTFTMLFAVGARRALVTADRWWAAGLEMLGPGVIVAAAAYASGAIVARLTGFVCSRSGSKLWCTYHGGSVMNRNSRR